MNIRIRVDLRPVLGNTDRARFLLQIPGGERADALPVSWLLRRLCALLEPVPAPLRGPLVLSVDGHFIPLREALSILRSCDTVVVHPLNQNNNLTYNARPLAMDKKIVNLSNETRNNGSGLNRSTENSVQQERNQPMEKKGEGKEPATLWEDKQQALKLLQSVAALSDSCPSSEEENQSVVSQASSTAQVENEGEEKATNNETLWEKKQRALKLLQSVAPLPDFCPSSDAEVNQSVVYQASSTAQVENKDQEKETNNETLWENKQRALNLLQSVAPLPDSCPSSDAVATAEQPSKYKTGRAPRRRRRVRRRRQRSVAPQPTVAPQPALEAPEQLSIDNENQIAKTNKRRKIWKEDDTELNTDNSVQEENRQLLFNQRTENSVQELMFNQRTENSVHTERDETDCPQLQEENGVRKDTDLASLSEEKRRALSLLETLAPSQDSDPETSQSMVSQDNSSEQPKRRRHRVRKRRPVTLTTLEMLQPTIKTPQTTIEAPQTNIEAPQTTIDGPQPTVEAPQPTLVAPQRTIVSTSPIIKEPPTIVAPETTIEAPPTIVAPQSTLEAPQRTIAVGGAGSRRGRAVRALDPPTPHTAPLTA